MEKKIRYTLGKNERLKSRKQIDILFKQGQSFSAFPFRIVFIVGTSDSVLRTQQIGTHLKDISLLQAGFTVSSKNFKHAVDRNRVKRLMREAYRLQKTELQELVSSKGKPLSVFFIFNGNELPEYEYVFAKMQKALKQLLKLFNEKVSANN